MYKCLGVYVPLCFVEGGGTGWGGGAEGGAPLPPFQ